MAKTHNINAKIKLSLNERIFIGTLFPATGNLVTLRVRRDILNKVEFSQEEIKKFELRPQGEMVLFNPKYSKTPFNYEFTELEKNEIKLALQALDKEGKMHISMIELCDKFNVISE